MPVYAENPRRSPTFAERSALRWARWILDQQAGELAVARARAKRYKLPVRAEVSRVRGMGLTKAALARELGVSPRAIRHWLAPEDSHDYRQAPISILNRLIQWNERQREALTLRREALDDIDELAQYRPAGLMVPLRQERYARPQLIGAEVVRSEIFEIDVNGLDLREILHVLRLYYRQLKIDGRDWLVRYLVLVNTENYFSGGVRDEAFASGRSDRSIHDSIKNRDEMPIWVPPHGDMSHRKFVYRGSIEERVINSQAMLLSGRTIHKYNERFVFDPFTRSPKILKISFAPFRAEGSKAKNRKRATGK